MIDWTHLPFVLAASRAGSLSAAARMLRVDPATVGRHVAALEKELGAKLLRRKKGAGLEPTEIGARVLAAASRTEEGLNEVVRVVRAESDRPSGAVRVTTVDILANGLIAPKLPLLHAQYPELVLDLIVTPQLLDLSRDVDLALRLSRPTDDTLIARRAGALAVSVYASRAYLERNKLDPRGPFRRLDAIQYGEQFLRVPENQWLEQVSDARVVLRTTSVGVALASATAGLGAAMVPDVLASADASLVRLPFPAVAREVWIAAHPDLAKSPRVRAVSDFFVAVVEGTLDRAWPRSRRARSSSR